MTNRQRAELLMPPILSLMEHESRVQTAEAALDSAERRGMEQALLLCKRCGGSGRTCTVMDFGVKEHGCPECAAVRSLPPTDVKAALRQIFDYTESTTLSKPEIVGMVRWIARRALAGEPR